MFYYRVFCSTFSIGEDPASRLASVVVTVVVTPFGFAVVHVVVTVGMLLVDLGEMNTAF